MIDSRKATHATCYRETCRGCEIDGRLAESVIDFFKRRCLRGPSSRTRRRNEHCECGYV